ncbi:DNA topoisomerase 4 subunit A, partial [bacterium]|nr:DNA topoisomerase 4 subunit A [bacterium]
HRRILYTMFNTGLHHNRPFVKSSRIVGDVMGRLHPHGDAAIYEALARLAQPFSMRYLLVDGQGNFGSVDGDRPAAMRYTEARLARIAADVLGDIDKDTVDWKPNYDEKELEPLALPTKVPMLLMNGSEGIAVGMATKVPPHNLGELLDGLIALCADPDLTVLDLMKFIPGPDFPTGGFIYGRQGIYEAYTTGRGRVRVRAKMEIETHPKTERETIVITEIPYQVNKARLLEEIAERVREKRIEGISDLRDESDRDGMRVVVELKRDAVSSVVMNLLYKLTNCSTTFGVINLALVDGQPKVLTLKEILSEFVDFRRDVVTKRCIFERAQAEARAHILEGLITALDNIDRIITIIRGSRTQEEAKLSMMAEFTLSDRQSQAILDMRLARLTGLEREKIQAEYDELQKLIEYLTRVLENPVLLMEIIVDEFKQMRERYADARRTQIVDDLGEFTDEDLIAEEDMVVTISHTGYIKRNGLSEYRAQRRGGRGKTGMTTKDEDFVRDLFVASTHSYLMIFTTFGRAYWVKVYNLPLASRTGKGKPIVNVVDLQPGDSVAAILPVDDFEADG